MVPVEFDLDLELRAVGAELVGDHRRRRTERPGDAHPSDAADRSRRSTPRRRRVRRARSPRRVSTTRGPTRRTPPGDPARVRGRHRAARSGSSSRARARSMIEVRLPNGVPSHREVAVRHRRVRHHDPIVDGERCQRPDAERRHPHPQPRSARRRAAGHGRRRRATRSTTTTSSTSASAGLATHATPPVSSSISESMRACSSAATSREDGLGVLVRPGDRRPREDVVELLRQHLLPERIDTGPTAERGRPQLRLDEQSLATAVAELGLQLAGERAPMRLEVQLAAPDGCRAHPARCHVRVGVNIASGVSTSSVARESIPASRRARSSISRVGPPPPSP